MLAQERNDALAGILKDNQGILMLESEDALAALNELGYDFTEGELTEFAAAMKASGQGELDFEQLGNVAGGIFNAICTGSHTTGSLNLACW